MTGGQNFNGSTKESKESGGEWAKSMEGDTPSLFSFVAEFLELIFVLGYESFKFSSCFLPSDLVPFMSSFLA